MADMEEAEVEDGGVARMRIASALEATGAYDGPLDLDLGNLCCSDPSPIDPAAGPYNTRCLLLDFTSLRYRHPLQAPSFHLAPLPHHSPLHHYTSTRATLSHQWDTVDGFWDNRRHEF